MNVKLHQLSERPVLFEFHLPRSAFPRLEERYEFDAMNCRAELTHKQDAVILQGSYDVDIHTGCDLCLESVSMAMNRSFELVLVNEANYLEPEGDVELSLRSEETDFFNGQQIELSGYFEDQLLLDLPFSIRCTETCQGICPQCGVNRNLESCRCTEETGSNPFSVLKKS